MYSGAMQMGAGRVRLAHAWQLPLLLVSGLLFGSAAYLFVDARPGISLNQKLAQPRELLRNDRPDAAAEHLQRLLEAEKLPDEQAAPVHLLLAEALEAASKQDDGGVAAFPLRIIEQTQIALAKGARPSGEIHRRLGESYEQLHKPVEAVWQYRQAIAIDPPRAIRLQRKVIDLQIESSDWTPAEASIDAYLEVRELTGAERAWAKSLKARLLMERGEFVEARTVLEEALRLGGTDPIARAEARYRLGVCAWKLGAVDEAKRLLESARDAFRGQHPLEADAAYALGQIADEADDAAGAIAQFDAAVAADAKGYIGALARLSRGVCRIESGGDAAIGVKDLLAVAERARGAAGAGAGAGVRPTSPQSLRGPDLRDAVLAALRRSAQQLESKQEPAAAIELLLAEQALDAQPPGGFFVRLGGAYEKHAAQVAQSMSDASPAEIVRREQRVRELSVKSADALLTASRLLAAAGDGTYGEALFRAMDQYDRGGSTHSTVAALETFVTERAADPLAADALARLAGTYERLGQAEKAMSAYGRLHGAYPQSPAAAKSAVTFGALLATVPEKAQAAEGVLAGVLTAPGRSDEDYRRALLELGRVQHRAGKLKEATARLEEYVAKFSGDDRLGEAMFLLGECYRASAQALTVQLASAAGAKAGAAEMESSAADRKARLSRAAEMYDRAVQHYRARVPTAALDQRYEKFAALRRADCAYELASYAEAIALYEAVAGRWSSDPVAFAAWVQIVNSQFALGRGEEARAAHERARALMSKLPGAGERGADVEMPRAYWEQWLKWTGMAAMPTL